MSSIASPTTTMRQAAIFASRVCRRSPLKRGRSVIVDVGTRDAKRGTAAGAALPRSGFRDPLSGCESPQGARAMEVVPHRQGADAVGLARAGDVPVVRDQV